MQKWTKPGAPPTRIAFLLFDRFSNLCLANCLEPLRAANAVSRASVFDWQILTMTGDAADSSSGMQVLPHGPAAAMERCDYLFVLASYGHVAHDTSRTRQTLRSAAKKARVLVGMDTGPWLLASAGLLGGRRATLHWDLQDAFAERFLDVDVERSRVTRDGPVITCAGAMSAIDLMMDLIAQHAGMAARLDVEDQFMHGSDTPATAPQSDLLVRRALEQMRAHVERPLPLGAIARRLGCQPRTLDRHFRRDLGAPPGTVYRHLRLSEARKLLDSTSLGIAEIAVRCGYESPAALARAMRLRYGAAPTRLRSEGAVASRVGANGTGAPPAR
ncbi:AraC family transcriptional regulator [Pelagivirga sediminicola]|uniref:AraC family transcriptional regulator n=2 Tax=Pelagivirga sediminicola TaxID=2170575 RepID=A0A2T7G7W2_9RHOB|nr:AraC family transcriptional regulator [Pelagivirga sediminicola]